MIIDCFGIGQWDLSDAETIFVQGVSTLLKIMIPVAITVYTLTVCKADPSHHRNSMLGLERMQEPDGLNAQRA